MSQGSAKVLGGYAVQGAEDWPIVTAYKTANEGRSNTTTLADDSELKVTLKANKTYHFRIVLWITCSSGTPDQKFAVAFSGITTNIIGWVYRTGHGIDLADVNSAMYAGSPLTEDTAISMTGDAPTGMPCVIEGTIEVGATGGDLAFRWAQNTSNAAVMYILRGSYIQAQEIG